MSKNKSNTKTKTFYEGKIKTGGGTAPQQQNRHWLAGSVSWQRRHGYRGWPSPPFETL